MGSGVASEKQTIKTLEEPPEGPVRAVIVRAVGPQTLKIIWKVGQRTPRTGYNLYGVPTGTRPTH